MRTNYAKWSLYVNETIWHKNSYHCQHVTSNGDSTADKYCSQGRPAQTSPEHPLKILFDHPGDVSIWLPRDVPIWRPNLTLKGRSWEVDSGRPQDVLRTSLEDLQSTQTWIFQNFFLAFLLERIRLTKSI